MSNSSQENLLFNVSLPSFAVLLAAYNGEAWIGQQLDSILTQRSVNVRIFISVDRSTDSTLALCEQRASDDPRITVLPYGERFGCAGKNFYRLVADVDTSNFNFIAFADQDDVWLEDKLSRAADVLLSSEAKAYSGDVIAFWEDGKQELIKKSYPKAQYDHFFEAAGPGCTYVFTTLAYQVVKSFLIKHLEQCQGIALHDWLFYAICREAGFKWFIDDQPKMLYRQHQTNQIGANNNRRAYFGRLKTVLSKDNWYRDQVASMLDLFDKNREVNLSRHFFTFHFRQVRRRPRDQIAILIMALLGMFA